MWNLWILDISISQPHQNQATAPLNHIPIHQYNYPLLFPYCSISVFPKSTVPVQYENAVHPGFQMEMVSSIHLSIPHWCKPGGSPAVLALCSSGAPASLRQQSDFLQRGQQKSAERNCCERARPRLTIIRIRSWIAAAEWSALRCCIALLTISAHALGKYGHL